MALEDSHKGDPGIARKLAYRVTARTVSCGRTYNGVT
jgi:hypothetical protein